MSASALSRSRIGNAKASLRPIIRGRPPRHLVSQSISDGKVKASRKARKEAGPPAKQLPVALDIFQQVRWPKAFRGKRMWFKSLFVASLLQVSVASGAH